MFLEIQSLFTEFPALQQLQPYLLPLIQPPETLISQRKSNGTQMPLTLDEGDAAFTEIFTKHVIPSLYEMYIFLQQRKGWAQTYLKKRIQTADSSSLVLKRLAPTPSILFVSLRLFHLPPACPYCSCPLSCDSCP